MKTFKNGIAILGIIVLLILANWSLIDRYIYEARPSPMSYSNMPFPTSKTLYTDGDIFSVAVTRCNDSDETLSSFATRRFVNKNTFLRIDLPPTITTVKPGCEDIRAEVLDPFPDAMPDGTYTFEGTSEIRTTHRVYIIPWTSAPFVYKRTP
jgi:hypothetical protein